VVDLVSQKTLVDLTRDLSSCGCFVKTKTPFPKGARVNVRITYSGATIAALGNVSDNVSHEGMGIGFVNVEFKDQLVLEQWRSHASAK
jgi:PilZ domain-containing protein